MGDLDLVVVRGPVDHDVALTMWASCEGFPDGTKCTKKLVKLYSLIDLFPLKSYL